MSETSPTISVVMAAYNASRFLREAVDSVLNQTALKFEFIIVDDGSTDTSVGILCGYDDPRIRLLRAPHSGLAKALNIGLAACKGEFIARMDADDVSDPARFAVQAEYLQQHPEVDILCSDILTINSVGAVTGRVVMEGLDNEVLRDGLL